MVCVKNGFFIFEFYRFDYCICVYSGVFICVVLDFYFRRLDFWIFCFFFYWKFFNVFWYEVMFIYRIVEIKGEIWRCVLCVCWFV